MGTISTYCSIHHNIQFTDKFTEAINRICDNTIVILADSTLFREIYRFDHFLNSYEKHQLGLLHMNISKTNFRIGRIITRFVSAAYFGINISEIDIIQKNENSKPYLQVNNDEISIHFSISHCSNMVAIAFNNQKALGIDLEKVKKNTDIHLIAGNYFTIREQKTIYESSNPEHEFFMYWTRKESIIKTLGGMLLQLIMNVEVLTGKNENEIIDLNEDIDIYTQTYFPRANYPLSISQNTADPNTLFYNLLPQDIDSWFSK